MFVRSKGWVAINFTASRGRVTFLPKNVKGGLGDFTFMLIGIPPVHPPLKNECSLRVLRAKFGTKIVSSGSHWRCEVVRHLCSQSESGRQMYFRPWHSPFGPQKDAFYRGQFVILTHVFAIVCPWNEIWNMRCCHYLPLSLKFKWRRNFGSRNKWQRDKRKIGLGFRVRVRKIGEWVGFLSSAKKIRNFKFNLNVSSYSVS